MTTQLEWLGHAKALIGTHEDKRRSFVNPVIGKMLMTMGAFTNERHAWWQDDETPWCGLFVGYCLGVSGRYVVKDWFRAKAWAEDAALTKLDKPAVGAIAVFSRQGGGHVGFVVGRDSNDDVMILGGNQSDAVNIKAFPSARALGYYWPARWVNGAPVKSTPLPERYALPLYANGAQCQKED